MRYLKLSGVFLLIYLIQTTVVSRFAVLGVKPDLLLVATALYAVAFGAEKGLVTGVVCGLIQDLFSGFFFMHTITKGLLGFLIGTLKESILGTEEAVVLSAVVTATATSFIFEFILLFFFFGKPLSSVWVLLITLFISCVYNGLIAFAVAPVIRWTSQMVFAEA